MVTGTHRWRVGAAAVVALCTLTASACDGDSGGGEPGAGGPSGEPTADTAADREAGATYGEELAAWSAELSDAVTAATEKDARDKQQKAVVAVLGAAPDLAPPTADEPPAEYVAATEIAARVDDIVAELGEYADEGRAGLLYYDVYDAYLDHHSAIFDLRSLATDQAFDRLGNPNAAELGTRQQIQRLDTDLRLLRTYDIRLATLQRRAGHDPLWVSAMEYQRSEVDWLVEFQRDYQRYVRAAGDYAASDAYSDRYYNEEFYFAQACLTAIEARAAMMRQLSRYVEELATLAGEEPTELTADVPTVGDVYRWRLTETVAPTGASGEKADEALTDQLWLLHRLKELEDTPADVYDEAREMLFLQVTADPRSDFETLIATVLALRGTFAGATDPKAKTVLDWVEQTLDPEAVGVLEPFQVQLRALVDRFRPAQRDVFADELWDYTMEKYEQVVTKAAKAIDDHRALAGQIRAAIAATRTTS